MQIEYASAFREVLYPGLFPKYASDLAVMIFEKIQQKSGTTIGSVSARRQNKHFIFYQEATQYWVKATIGLPFYAKNGIVGPLPHGRYVYFDTEQNTSVACAMMNSSLFYTYFIAFGDCFHLSDTLVSNSPIPYDLLTDCHLIELGSRLQKSLMENSQIKTIQARDGAEISYAEFSVSKSKPIIDDIDRSLAEHYGFTVDELDFIIYYDAKYRVDQYTESNQQRPARSCANS